MLRSLSILSLMAMGLFVVGCSSEKGAPIAANEAKSVANPADAKSAAPAKEKDEEKIEKFEVGDTPLAPAELATESLSLREAPRELAQDAALAPPDLVPLSLPSPDPTGSSLPLGGSVKIGNGGRLGMRLKGQDKAGAHPRDGEFQESTEGLGPGQGGDKFSYIPENDFLKVKDTPLSTFSIDVDTASYSKVRSYLKQHHSLPPADAIRLEEMINYFDYAYEGPKDNHPFGVHIESAACPWAEKHRLVRFGIQGKKLENQRPASNLVFLLDVSGSMDHPQKLPLVIYGMKLLANQLGENDKVSIVVYAGAAGLVLPPTSGEDKTRIIGALEGLYAGGSTNGGQGIHLAYSLAQENFIKGGVNRVILCSDGDFNVGTTSTGDLVRLAIEKSKSGVFLSVLGFGIGNHNDEMLEQIANKANGNYGFIDSQAEARKVLVEQLSGTLVTIAKDVKIQVEFNPAQVASYRLLGYENRKLADRDFNDDKKDAGEIGAGHSITVLYEIVPPGAEPEQAEVDPLKYQKAKGGEVAEKGGEHKTEFADELLTLKMRYQPPAGGASTLMTFPVKDNQQKFGQASKDFQFAASVASFGMLLRNSQHKGATSYAAVLETATAARGDDKFGYRAEFLELVKAAQDISGNRQSSIPADWRTGRDPRSLAWNRPSLPATPIESSPPAMASPPVVIVAPMLDTPGWDLLYRGFIACSFFAMIGGLGAAVGRIYLSSRSAEV